MLTTNPKITGLMHDDVMEKYAKMHKISLQEAKGNISEMTFGQYLRLLEDGSNLIPPSGQPIGPGKPNSTDTSKVPTWTSNALPMAKDMIVGITGANGMPEEGTVTDILQDTVDVRGLDGKVTTYNQKDPRLVPVAAKKPVPVPAINTQTQQQTQLQPQAPNQVQEEKDLARMKQLAGISENCSGGATGAGGVAVMAQNIAPIKKRYEVDEVLSDESIANGVVPGRKSVIGNTRWTPTDVISANLANKGKRSTKRSARSMDEYHDR